MASQPPLSTSPRQEHTLSSALVSRDRCVSPEHNPDVIFFVCDGEFDPETVELVKQKNTRNVIINAVNVGDRNGEEVLKAIAEQNGGTYRHAEE